MAHRTEGAKRDDKDDIYFRILLLTTCKGWWDRDDGGDYDDGKGCDDENGDYRDSLSAHIFSFNSSKNLSLFMYLTTWCPHMMNVDFEII